MSSTSLKLEIQGLRAIAVSLVVIFHIWPDFLPGGFVGVDVFFVISGYLITGVLLRQVTKDGYVKLGEFYVRRARRLMPAATVVLVAVALCTPLLPAAWWEDTAFELLASAFYFQNWWLAAQAVDYLAADNMPGPLQHYWSLSVEEQYYLFWPVLLLLCIKVFKLKKASSISNVFAYGIATVALISIAYSIWLTPENPGLAYFSSATRAWELALGGLLAVLPRWQKLSRPYRGVLGGVGLSLISCSAILYSKETQFPGYAALLPTLGAAFIIMAGDARGPLSVYWLLRRGVLQYIGGLSYSLYLWHWPVIIIFAQYGGTELGLVEGAALFAISVALAHQTKYLVEDRFRKPHPNILGSQNILVPASFAGLCVLSSLAIYFNAYRTSPGVIVESAEMYPGALVLTDKVRFSERPFIPVAAHARKDLPEAYAKPRCYTLTSSSELVSCEYGNLESNKTVAVIGDSHALHWMPALQLLAEANSIKLVLLSKSACAVGMVHILNRDKQVDYSCYEWNSRLREALIQINPDIVISSQSIRHVAAGVKNNVESKTRLGEALASLYSDLISRGSMVIAIRDTPWMAKDIPECMSVEGRVVRDCSTSREDALLEYDPVVMAARSVPGVNLFDFTDAMCEDSICPAVIGNVLVYRDRHHLTATFAKTLAPALDAKLRSLLDKL
ncbi:acyltransferase family protein [Stutzerimonas chloritidismutans]|uniref:acyltransferase family protein n=1 Tax=Stutzerimonas chloritidismutans TaxID=203192 RepID=UPI002898570C|nr:acyltransferase family protein [Stutzerimonas chloritidismutans]